MDMDTLDILRAIELRDPDGFPTQPTADDYRRHESWAVAMYGRKVWETYSRGGWGAQPEV